MAFAVSAGAGADAKRVRAITTPLSVFECVANVTATSDVKIAGNFKIITSPVSTTSIEKTGIVLFLAEVLGIVLREPMPDAQLFDTLSDSIEKLCTRDSNTVANYHIAFLLLVARELGIEPDWSTVSSEGAFDFFNGVWGGTHQADGRFRYAAPEESQVLASLKGITIDNCMEYRLKRTERNMALDVILKYFSMQGFKTDNLSSLKILREIY